MKNNPLIRHMPTVPLLILTILAAVGLSCSLSMEESMVNASELADTGFFLSLLTYLGRWLGADRMKTWAALLLTGILIAGLPNCNASRRGMLCAAIFAVAFSFLQLIGHALAEAVGLTAYFTGSVYNRIRTLLVFIGVGITAYACILHAFRLVDTVKPNREAGSSGSVKKVLLTALLLFVCWLPYFIYFYPGVSNGDTGMQIAWAFHRRTLWLSFTSMQGDNIFATNHHPYFLTLLYGAFAKLGVAMGNINTGIAIYVVLQMLAFAIIQSAMWSYFRQCGLNRKLYRAGVIFTALFPAFPMTAILVVKDTIFGYSCLVFSLLLFEVTRTRGTALKNLRFCLRLAAAALMVCLTKSQGIYILIIVAIAALLLYLKKYWKQVLCTLFIPIILFQGLWMNVLLPAWKVAPVGKQESIGWMMQQTARYALEYGDEVTQEEMDAINRVMDYATLEWAYDPDLSDPVKWLYNQSADEEDLKAYYSAWLSMFRKHPEVYITALISNFYGYFYLNSDSKTGGEGNIFYYKFYNEVDEDDEIYISNRSAVLENQEALLSAGEALEHIPGLNILLSPGNFSWIVFFVFLNTIRKRKYTFLLAQLTAVISIGVLILTPLNSCMRYVWPVFYCVPLLLFCCTDAAECKPESCS